MGSKEAKELERIKKIFAEAYKQSETQKNTAEDGGVRYSISKDIDGNAFVDITENIFDANNGESIARTIQRVISERFDNLIEANEQKIQINKKTNDEFRRSKSANALLKNSSEAYNDKLKTIANADEIMIAAKNWIGEKNNHIRTDDIVEFARGNIMYRVGEKGYVADVIVGTRRNGAAVLYDLVNIYDKKITEAPVTMASQNDPQRRQDASVDPILSQSGVDVNTKLSLGEDPSGNTNGYRVYGRDVMLEDLGPIRDDIAPKTEAASLGDDIPIRDDIAKSAGRFVEVELPIREDAATPSTDDILQSAESESEAAENGSSETETAPTAKKNAPEEDAEPITTTKERLTARLKNAETELNNNRELRENAKKIYDSKIDEAQAKYDIGVSGVDGSFGAKTEAALKAYQADNGLESDGSCGRKTWTKILNG